MFGRSLFVLLSFFFWPLCCQFFFELRIQIISFGIFKLFYVHVQSVHITTNVVNSNPLIVRFTRNNIMWYSLSVSCDRSVVLFSLVSFTNKIDRHYITEILLKGTSNAITLTRYWITRPIKNSVPYKIGPYNFGSLPTRSTILYNLSCRTFVYKRHPTIRTTTVVVKLNCIS